MNKKALNILILLSIALAVLIIFSSTIFGWYGYEKWKYRRDTYGDVQESKDRNVFVKKLNFYSNVEIDNFKCYIEKGYWFGKNSMNDTDFKFTKFPYQISFNGIGNNRYLQISNTNVFDSITNEDFQRPNIYLVNRELKDTLILKIMGYKNRDSIGYIKIWDKDVVGK